MVCNYTVNICCYKQHIAQYTCQYHFTKQCSKNQLQGDYKVYKTKLESVRET